MRREIAKTENFVTSQGKDQDWNHEDIHIFHIGDALRPSPDTGETLINYTGSRQVFRIRANFRFAATSLRCPG